MIITRVLRAGLLLAFGGTVFLLERKRRARADVEEPSITRTRD